MTVVSKPSPVRRPAHSRATSAWQLRSTNVADVGAGQQDPHAPPEAHTPPVPTSPEEAPTRLQRPPPWCHLRHTSRARWGLHARAPSTHLEAHPGHMGMVGSQRPGLTPLSPLPSPLRAPCLTVPSEGTGQRGLVSREDHLPQGCVQLPGQ